MNWRHRLLTLFGLQPRSGEAAAAGVAAELSCRHAVSQRDEMARLREQADMYAETIRAHNSANRYDDWLRHVMRGDR